MSAALQDVAGKAFDYVIIGGGTAGLPLAARLSEDPDVTVVVLEAGGTNFDDPLLLTPANFAAHFGNKLYDWGHVTTKQKLASDRPFSWARGRGLGGSSSINFMVWSRPPAEEINDLERLGNPGWNWKNYRRYALKTERFAEPSVEQRQNFNLPLHEGEVGRDGAVAISYPKTISELERHIIETWKNAGIPPASHPYGGDPAGCYYSLNNHDARTVTRSYAVTAYYLPIKDRKNLTVFTGALVSRILTDRDLSGNLTATGAEFIHTDKAYVVHARKEVIVSAGALKSPQILELSGIGQRDVLEKAGVDVKIDLTRVGENLQEHVIMGGIVFQLKDGYDFPSLDSLREPEKRAEQLKLYESKREGAFTMGVNAIAFLPIESVSPRAEELYAKARATVEQLAQSGDVPPGLLEQYKIQLERLEPDKNQTGPGCEILGGAGTTAGARALSASRTLVRYTAGSNHAFSRGAIHIISKDPLEEPEIDPRYFEHEVDLDILLDTVKFLRKIPQQFEPLKDMIEHEVFPGPDVTTDEQLIDLIKESYGTTWHTCGTCSMMPRDKGGVVDHTLKVYGTNNIRVVDLSVVPLHFAGHTQSTAYVIAEQAADIIKGNL